LTDWHAVAHVTDWIDVAGGLLFAALGAYLLTRRERSALLGAFAAYALSYGCEVILTNLAEDLALVAWPWDVLGNVLLVVASVPLFVLAVGLTRPTRHERVLVPTLVLLLFAAGNAVAFAPPYADVVVGIVALAQFAAITAGWTAVFSFLAFLALRYRRADPAERAGVVFVAMAFGIEHAFRAGISIGVVASNPNVPAALGFHVPRIIALAAVVALWFANVRWADRAAARTARNVALAYLGLALAALVVSALTDPYAAGDLGFIGVARFAGVALLGVAIARGLVPGIETRARWALSRTTVGAAFVAVFFIFSTLAQSFFQTSLGPVVGVLAAGGLVFALAPLQSAADRIAARAIPSGAQAVPRGVASAADAFRGAVRLALDGGPLTREREATLAMVGHELGLAFPEAHRIIVEEEAKRA
jgi:hypothetical protein